MCAVRPRSVRIAMSDLGQGRAPLFLVREHHHACLPLHLPRSIKRPRVSLNLAQARGQGRERRLPANTTYTRAKVAVLRLPLLQLQRVPAA